MSCLRISFSFSVLPSDMGQRYSSLITGLSVGSLSIGYILNPIIMGYLVPNHVSSKYQNFLSRSNVSVIF